jgi:hypothetical protein
VGRQALRGWTALPAVLLSLYLAALAPVQASGSCAPAADAPCKVRPDAATLGSFEAVPDSGSVTLVWETAAETNEAGFVIFRRHVRTGLTERLNRFLIPAQGTSSRGASYAFIDMTALNGVEYEYALEGWSLDGRNEIHPSARSVPNPVNPALKLTAPAYNESAGSIVRFEWVTPGRLRFTVEVSSDGDFSRPGTLELGAGVRTYRVTTSREMARIRSMGDTEGGIYWRVTGRDALGTTFRSQTLFLEIVP